MSDVLSPEQRRRCMSAIKSADTKPELIVRRYLFSRGLRYRLHSKKLPGTPDLVFPKYRSVVFIHGCFWHGHEECGMFRFPKSNEVFWRTKIEHNVKRDVAVAAALLRLGWRVLVIWECTLKKIPARKLWKIYTKRLQVFPFSLIYILFVLQ